MKRIIIVMMIFLLIPQVVFAELCEDYEQKTRWNSTLGFSETEYTETTTGNWPWFYSVLSGGAVTVIDIHNPQRPEIAAIVEFPFAVSKLVASEDLIMGYDAHGNIATMDFTDPLHPVTLDTLVISGNGRGACLVGDRAWMRTSNDEVLILNTTPGAGLELLGRWSCENTIYKILEHDGLAYVLTYLDLFIMDFSDPEVPNQVGYYPNFGRAGTFAGDILIAGDIYEFKSYDVSDPANLVILDTVETDKYDVRLFAHNNYILVQFDWNRSRSLYSISDAGIFGQETVLVEDEDYLLLKNYIFEDYVYLSSYYNLSIVAIADVNPPQEVATLPSPEPLHTMVLKDGYGFASMEQHGLCVFDLSDPAAPFIAGSGFTPHSTRYIELQDDLAVMAGNSSVSVLNISHPTLPEYLGSLNNIPDFIPTGIALHNNMAWFSNMFDPVVIIDFSDSANPVHSLTTDFTVDNLAIDHGLLHTTHWEGSYKIYSLETMPPQVIGQIELERYCNNIEIQGSRVVVCHGRFGMSLLDISDPTNPILLDHIKVMYSADVVTFKGDQVVVSCEGFTHILSIDENQKFKTEGTIWEGGYGNNILPGGEILLRQPGGYFADSSLKIYPAPCSFPAAVPDQMYADNEVLSVYPNPFNPNSIIGFTLEKTGVITLRVYDLTGRLVKELVSAEVVEAGARSWSWDGRDMTGRHVSSGMYLVQLRGEGFQASGRMVLIR